MEIALPCLIWKEEPHDIFLWQKTFSDCISRDFPDHPVVKTPSFLARGKGLIPGWGTVILMQCSVPKTKSMYMGLNSVYCQQSAFWLQLICAKAYIQRSFRVPGTCIGAAESEWLVEVCTFDWSFLYPQRILTHAYSRVVLRVLEAAVAAKKRFSVYITESQPDLSGQVSFHVVMCPAIPLMRKLRMRPHCKRSQAKPPICLSISIAFHSTHPSS